MNTLDATKKIRDSLASFDASVSHSVSGQDRPKADEIYAPEHHAGALDPHVPIVLGARGSGKSFWAGVLGNKDTLVIAAKEYPRLGLEKLEVQFGFIGQEGGGAVSRETMDKMVPEGEENEKAPLFWRAVVMRGVQRALNPQESPSRIKDLIEKYSDPEDWEEECQKLDGLLFGKQRTALIIFDALDALAYEHDRLRKLLDAVFRVTWSMRSYQAIRLKLFLRDDQISRLGLRFVELPKLIAGATRLKWHGTDLYGMLYARLATDPNTQEALDRLLKECGLPPTAQSLGQGRMLFIDKTGQAQLFTRLAGQYMGRGHKKGKTYDWPLNHLSDGHDEVTPRSFLVLMIHAAKHLPPPENTVLSAEGIRNGLREASKIRVEQLALEFPWIRRVLAPLALLQVPCADERIKERWLETGTQQAIRKMRSQQGFMLPFASSDEDEAGDELLATLKMIGVLKERDDGRYDMPDLFRVAARLLKKGGVSPI